MGGEGCEAYEGCELAARVVKMGSDEVEVCCHGDDGGGGLTGPIGLGGCTKMKW